MNAPIIHFEIQRYWRNKWIPSRSRGLPGEDVPNVPDRVNAPWQAVLPDGQLLTGAEQISYPDFIRQFKEDA